MRELLSLNRNQLRILTGLFTGHLSKLEPVDSPECDRCKQASETALRVLGDCEALATIRFRYLGYHFMKPGDFKDISVSRLLHFVQSAGR
jgi:hypothetical protein